MKIGIVLVCAVFSGLVFCGTATPGHAADKAKNRKTDIALPSMQLGDYSIKLATDEPRQGAPEPSGLTAMRQDSPRAFLGFSLSRPLPDGFWNFAR
jgi:hypothetical protein